MKILAQQYIHPDDRAALDNLKAIPFFTTLLKSFMGFFSEQQLHGLNMAQKIRLSPNQLPDIYNLLPPIVEKLGINEPELYLEMSPTPNAYTYGDTNTFITITSGLLESLDEGELKAVIGHECGHIACNHVLYHTMANYIFNFGIQNFGLLKSASMPIQIALFSWYRKSELSADRAAAVALGGQEEIVETMIRLAGGPKSITKDINIEEYIKQADAYQELKMGCNKDKLLQFLVRMYNSHPFNAERTKEILKWCNSDEYKHIISQKVEIQTMCPNCGGQIEENWKFCLHCGYKL